jgi:hypothetical protein
MTVLDRSTLGLVTFSVSHPAWHESTPQYKSCHIIGVRGGNDVAVILFFLSSHCYAGLNPVTAS